MVHEGSIIGSYRVTAKLGEGGMGAVWLAEHVLLGRRAAIKVLQPAFSTRADIIDRFFREARTASTVADPGIVQIFDFGYHRDGSAFILMELLDGEPLDARLRRLGRLPIPQALRIVRQIAGSLASAHAQGIVHRDLKPANVILVPDAAVPGGERAKILDFGIAKLVDSDTIAPQPQPRRTPTGPVMGTPVYMSPEQSRGAHDLDHRSDIYSLGCVLFHLLTGRPPFEAGSAVDLLAKHLIEPPPLPSRIVELSPELDAVILCCLAKRPRDRFQTMAELVAGIGLALAPDQARALDADHEAVPRLSHVPRPRAVSLGVYTTQVSIMPAEPAPTTSAVETAAEGRCPLLPAERARRERARTELAPTERTGRRRRSPARIAVAALAAGIMAALLGGGRTGVAAPTREPDTSPATACAPAPERTTTATTPRGSSPVVRNAGCRQLAMDESRGQPDAQPRRVLPH